MTGPVGPTPAANGAARPQAPPPAAAATKPATPAAPAKPVVQQLPKIVVKRSVDIIPAKYLHLMVLGFGKVGKTSCTVGTAPGPVLVINSDDPDESLEPAREFNDDFLHVDAHSPAEMSACIVEAHRLAKAGEVATVVWDTITGFSPFCEAAAFAQTTTSAGKEDGRKASPLYKKTMRSFIQRLKTLPCHLIVNSHYIDVGGGGDEDEQVGLDKVWDKKSPQGIVPNLYGSFRAEICGMFSDIVFMEKILQPGGREARVFVTGINGVYGPGCRSIPGNKQLPADIGEFLKMKRNRPLAAQMPAAPARPPMPAVAATQPRPAAPVARPAAAPIVRPAAPPVRR